MASKTPESPPSGTPLRIRALDATTKVMHAHPEASRRAFFIAGGLSISGCFTALFVPGILKQLNEARILKEWQDSERIAPSIREPIEAYDNVAFGIAVAHIQRIVPTPSWNQRYKGLTPEQIASRNQRNYAFIVVSTQHGESYAQYLVNTQQPQWPFPKEDAQGYAIVVDPLPSYFPEFDPDTQALFIDDLEKQISLPVYFYLQYHPQDPNGADIWSMLEQRIYTGELPKLVTVDVDLP